MNQAIKDKLKSVAVNIGIFALATFGTFWGDAMSGGQDPLTAAKTAAVKTVTATAVYVAAILKGVQQLSAKGGN